MNVKKPLVALLALGLVGATLVAPAQAKKKKPKKPPALAQVDQKYYPVNQNESGCAAEGMLLMLTPGEAGGSCGSTVGGAPNTVFTQASGKPCTPDSPVGSLCGTISYTAGEGLPMVLDASKKISGTIYVSSYRGAAQNPTGLSAGPTTFNMLLYGTVNGEEKEIGTFTSDYTVTPAQQEYEVPFEITIDPALDKGQVETLGVDFWNTGATALHGFYAVNKSFITFPTWK